MTVMLWWLYVLAAVKRWRAERGGEGWGVGGGGGEIHPLSDRG